MAQFPLPSIEAVLVSEIRDADPLLVLLPQTRLGDLSLDILIHHAATCPCTNIELPEEVPYGDIDLYF